MHSIIMARLNHRSWVGYERVAHKPSDSSHHIHFTGRCWQYGLPPWWPSVATKPQQFTWIIIHIFKWLTACVHFTWIHLWRLLWSPLPVLNVCETDVAVCLPVLAVLLGSLSQHFAPWTLAVSHLTHRTALWSWKAVSINQILRSYEIPRYPKLPLERIYV